jgi:hypothetical protein
MVLWWVLSSPVASVPEIIKVLPEHLKYQFSTERAGALFAAGPLGQVGERTASPRPVCLSPLPDGVIEGRDKCSTNITAIATATAATVSVGAVTAPLRRNGLDAMPPPQRMRTMAIHLPPFHPLYPTRSVWILPVDSTC